MKIIIKFFLLALFCFYPSNLISQQNIEVNGKVIDKQTGQPLPYANIGLIKNSVGTISNQDGEFRFLIPTSLKNDKIVFSYLGYKTFALPVADCIEKNLQIKLSILPIKLSAVTIKYQSPQELILEALDLINRNYLNHPVTLTTFYREMVRENKEPVQFIEAVMEVYKGAYTDKKDKDRIRIVKAREKDSLKPSIFFDYLYFVDGPYEALGLDIGKYPQKFIHVLNNSANFLLPKHFKHYVYKFKEAVDENNYIITFKPKTKKALLEGKLILDRQSLAVLSLEFCLADEQIARAQLINYDNEKYINSMGFYFRALAYHCYVNFKKYNNRFVFNNSRLAYSFHFINSITGEKHEIANSIEFVVTKVDKENVTKFKSVKSVWRNVSLNKQLGSYDPNFWENYNIIKSKKDD